MTEIFCTSDNSANIYPFKEDSNTSTDIEHFLLGEAPQHSLSDDSSLDRQVICLEIRHTRFKALSTQLANNHFNDMPLLQRTTKIESSVCEISRLCNQDTAINDIEMTSPYGFQVNGGETILTASDVYMIIYKGLIFHIDLDSTMLLRNVKY